MPCLLSELLTSVMKQSASSCIATYGLAAGVMQARAWIMCWHSAGLDKPAGSFAQYRGVCAMHLSDGAAMQAESALDLHTPAAANRLDSIRQVPCSCASRQSQCYTAATAVPLNVMSSSEQQTPLAACLSAHVAMRSWLLQGCLWLQRGQEPEAF